MQSIPRRLSHCILGGELFEKGDEYISFLDPEGNRKDFCTRCWAKKGKPSEGSFWKGVIPPKKEKLSLPDENALKLFRSTLEPKMRFVLALYLHRKKQLFRRTETLYELPETGELFHVERQTLLAQESVSLAQWIDEQIA